jgi:hypothetical protein
MSKGVLRPPLILVAFSIQVFPLSPCEYRDQKTQFITSSVGYTYSVEIHGDHRDLGQYMPRRSHGGTSLPGSRTRRRW